MSEIHGRKKLLRTYYHILPHEESIRKKYTWPCGMQRVKINSPQFDCTELHKFSNHLALSSTREIEQETVSRNPKECVGYIVNIDNFYSFSLRPCVSCTHVFLNVSQPRKEDISSRRS